NLKNEDTAT
nr:immunoglobulin heavy chain junction region [Mus musculus]